MSKIIFTQEFDSYEEREEFKIASQANEMSAAISEINELLRKYEKYDHPFKSIEEAIEKIREEVYQIISDHNVSLE